MTAQPGPIRLAVIDSDSGFVRVLANRLDGIGWEYRTLLAPPLPDELLAMRLNALVIDLAALGSKAWDYLGRIAEALPGLGVVVCTGQSSLAQRVRGLRLGADDWITKPCHPEEVLARVEAVVRRRKRAVAPADVGPMVAGELEVRGDQYQAFVAGRSAELTRREFELLEMLADAEGQVFQREELYQRVWGYEMARGDRSVDVFVRKLRSKLKQVSPGWTYIHTHFGIGYRFQAEPAPVEGVGGEEDPLASPGAGRGAAGRVSLFRRSSLDATLLELLDEAGRNVERATALLREMVADYPERADLARDILICEQEGDRLTHHLIHHVNQASGGQPVERGELRTLARCIDDIVDHAEETADSLGLYGIEAPMDQAEELAGVLARAAASVARALTALGSQNGSLSSLLVEIHELENEGDRLSRDAIAALFTGGVDPMVVIRWKDLFESLERGIDACETVAHMLEGIVQETGR